MQIKISSFPFSLYALACRYDSRDSILSRNRAFLLPRAIINKINKADGRIKISHVAGRHGRGLQVAEEAHNNINKNSLDTYCFNHHHHRRRRRHLIHSPEFLFQFLHSSLFFCFFFLCFLMLFHFYHRRNCVLLLLSDMWTSIIVSLSPILTNFQQNASPSWWEPKLTWLQLCSTWWSFFAAVVAAASRRRPLFYQLDQPQLQTTFLPHVGRRLNKTKMSTFYLNHDPRSLSGAMCY